MHSNGKAITATEKLPIKLWLGADQIGEGSVGAGVQSSQLAIYL